MKNNKSTTIALNFQIIIILIWALPQMSTDIYLPSLPAMAHYFNKSLATIQYTIFFYTIGYSIGALLFGPLSDRIGRKPVILWSLGVAALTSCAAIFTINIHELLVIRLIQGFAMVGVASTIRVIVKDVSPTITEMVKLGSLLGITIPIASAIAPVIGGYIQQYLNWRFSFGFLFIYVVAFFIYILFYLPETNKERLGRSLKYIHHDYIEILRNKVFLRYNIITAIALCLTFSYLTLSPYLLQIKMGLSPASFGYTFMLITAGLILSGYLNRKMIHKCNINKIILIGMLLMGVAGILFIYSSLWFPKNVYITLFAMFLMIFGSGFIYPNASAGGLSLFSKQAGAASSVYTCVQMIGGTIGSGLISFAIIHYNNTQLFLGLLVLILAIIGLIFAYQNDKHPSC